jgi:hypothetical protein
MPSVTPSAAPTSRSVSVVVNPADSRVTMPGGALGKVEKGVMKVEVAPGQKLVLAVTHAGYHPSQVTLGEGSSEIERVDLVSLSKPAPAPTPPAPVAPPATTAVAPPTTAAPTATATAPKPASGKSRPTWCDNVRDRGELYPECK